MQATLTGTLYIYQGEEIAHANLPESWPIEEYKDIASQEYFFEELEARKLKQNTDNPDMADVWDGLQRKSRDHARNPMQWDDSKHAGFSTGSKTWMRVHDDYREWNVAKQVGDPDSVLEFWRAMLRFRKKHLACACFPQETYSVFQVLTDE